MLTVIVDGNNVLPALKIHRLPEAEQFLQKMELAAVSKDWEVVVIFDGTPRYLPRETGPLTVIYAVGKPADVLIERRVYQAADRAQVVVVTQDRAVGQLVAGFGARVWSAQRLVEELDRMGEIS
jgi:predicted RNA-binding protein with PIN domain